MTNYSSGPDATTLAPATQNDLAATYPELTMKRDVNPLHRFSTESDYKASWVCSVNPTHK